MKLKTHEISLRKSDLFDDLFLDYIEGNEKINPFYSNTPDVDGIKKMITECNFSYLNREVLVTELNQQYQGVRTSELTKKNIESLLSKNTHTVTTGHQLCLFTGPLYFIYKIISTINACEELNKQINDKHFVPVYWMATEDHDFEEINHVNLFGKKIAWQTNEKGRAGELSTEGIKPAIEELKTILGNSESSEKLIQLFEKAYLQHNDLASATRYLVNELFGKYGLVILDSNSAKLKALFSKEIELDLFSNISYVIVNSSISELKEKGYKAQVNPREINSFYAVKNLRERIERDGDKYKIVNTDLVFSKEELQQKLKSDINCFSPNVVLRPLYQQKILPNIAYVGGPGEIAYWIEYKAMFLEYGIHFPVLVPRNFIIYVDAPTNERIQKLGIAIDDLFLETEALLKQYVKSTNADFNLEAFKQKISTVFDELKLQAESIDKSIIAATDAEKQKSLNSISIIEQKLIKALKTKSEVELGQLKKLKEKLFPNNIPQERVDNFSTYYLRNIEFIDSIMQSVATSLSNKNVIVVIENL